MAEIKNPWSEPKSDYVATDQVLPGIFNELAKNEKHLKEIACEVLVQDTATGTEVRANKLVIVDSKPYIEGTDGTLTPIQLDAVKATKDGNGNTISSTYVTKTGVEDITNKTYNGYTLGDACAKGVADSSSAEALGTSTNLPTERDVYNGLPTINGSHSYNKDTNIYAPTSQLATSTEKRYLIGSSATTSMNTESTNASCYMQGGHLYSNGNQVVNKAMFVLNGSTLTITTT